MDSYPPDLNGRDLPFEESRDCIRCRMVPAVDEHGYCGHCHWSARAEVEEGLYSLREYLRAWARFDEWCRAHGQAAV